MTGDKQLKSIREHRDSNIELFRIITMLLIVAHHYVVNSGLNEPIYANIFSKRSAFLLLFGAWGKTGINCFVLITGYFMCKSNITFKKFSKLLLEVYFYRIIIYGIFFITGYKSFSVSDIISIILPFTQIGQNFTACYLVFFLCIPFLNVLVQNMTEKQHCFLLLLIGTVYIIAGSLPIVSITFNYVTWFCIIYIISSYIRLYPKKLWNNTKL